MSRLGKVRVLVVDEDKGRADSVSRRLCGDDFEVVNATSNSSATRLLATEEFDLLIREQRGVNSHREPELVGSCPAMLGIADQIEEAAKHQVDIHVLGEVGAGKSLVARKVHRLSGCSGAFVQIHLSGLDPAAMEAALFDAKGPSSGTLFLDGGDVLPIVLQERLCRERQSGLHGEYRLIIASALPLAHESCASMHLEPSSVTQIVMPALRDRGEDISRLAIHFVAESMRQLGRQGIMLGRQAMAELCNYVWPGNVAELKSVIHDTVARSADHTDIGAGVMLSGGKTLIVEQVVGDIIGGCRGLDAAMAELEAAVIREALEQQHGNRSAAARQLKLPRQTLQDRMKKHGLWS